VTNVDDAGGQAVVDKISCAAGDAFLVRGICTDEGIGDAAVHCGKRFGYPSRMCFGTIRNRLSQGWGPRR
jgi:hypothetical protein